MSYQRGVRPDYTVGTITLVSNSKNFTTVGASLKTATIGSGDTIMTADGRVLIISEITGQNTGVLAYPCPASAAGANLPLRIRFQPSSSGVQGAVRDLLERWGLTGNIDAIAGLETAKDMLVYFTGAGTADVTALTEWARTLLVAANGGKGYEALGGVPDNQMREGLKEVKPAVSDFNDVIANGWYWGGGATVNTPDNSASWYMMHINHGSPAYCVQFATIVGTTSPRTLVRKKNNNVWSSWETTTLPILGNVSQSGGTPTGAIIQRGSNANGEFVRFADGTQFCMHTYNQDAIVDLEAGVLFMSRDTYTWNFPASFSSVQSGQVTVRRPPGTNYGIFTVTENITKNAYAWRILRSVARADDLSHSVYLFACGRWF